VLFHAFPGRLQGGFVGVDIFFVISGYLISSIILTKLDDKEFSVVEFYKRRVKRIFPAIILVLFSCLIFGWFFLLADEFNSLGKHVIASISFSSNLLLLSEGGYFDNAPYTKPLLHFWSLGIEEQFYILWPVILLVAARLDRVFLSIFGILVLSFLSNLYLIERDSVATFYAPFTRFWELAVGGCIACGAIKGKLGYIMQSPLFSNLFSISGVVLISCSVILLDKTQNYPGWRASIPVLGTALIITAGEGAYINRRLLSQKVAVWFGLISFPLYLWHWPILSFAVIAEGDMPSRIFRIAAIFSSIFLAWSTYEYIEKPIRRSDLNKHIPQLLAISLVLGFLGYFIVEKKGLPEREAVTSSEFTELVRHQFMGSLWEYTSNDICLDRHHFPDSGKYLWWFCMQNVDDNESILLLGNSYANQLYPGFATNRALEHHVVLSIGTCDPAAEVNTDGDPKGPCYGARLAKQRQYIDEFVSSTLSLRFVIIDGLSLSPDEKYIERLQSRLETLERVGLQLVIFVPHLRPGFNPKSCYKTYLRTKARDCSFSLRERKMLNDNFSPLLVALSRSHPNVKIFDQNDIFCSIDECSYINDGMPLNRDVGHLSEYGSILIQDFFSVWAMDQVPEIFEL